MGFAPDLGAHEATCVAATALRIAKPLEAKIAALEANVTALGRAHMRLESLISTNWQPTVGLDGLWIADSDINGVCPTIGLPWCHLVRNGAWYFEMTILSSLHSFRVGFVTPDFVPDEDSPSVGDDENSWAFSRNGFPVHDNEALNDDDDDEAFDHTRWGPGDCISLVLIVEDDHRYFVAAGFRNGRRIGVMVIPSVFPALSMTGGYVQVNFGTSPFMHFRKILANIDDLLQCDENHGNLHLRSVFHAATDIVAMPSPR